MAIIAAGPKSPVETLASLRVPNAFLVDLVAAEPLVVDPVSIAWDASGRMFVVEMTDYPNEKTGGRIKLLLDENGDGRMDRAHVFAEGLPFPTSVLPSRGGVLVTAAPCIWHLADTDGDHKADIRKVMLSGFGEGNQQLRVNGLAYGLDNWIYGANGRSDGEIHPTANPNGPPVSIHGRDFRFRPDGSAIEAVGGFSQFGQAFDDWGNRFLSWNTVHIRHVVLDERYLLRNQAAALGPVTAHIADHGDAGPVFPLTTPQPRMNREPPGYFNASCGLTIERGGLFPAPYRGSAFVCEPLFNIVHRDELIAQGATFAARRGDREQAAEFIASTDPWFRPVNLTSGPDGALYVADFYREWVEHPQFVPDELEKGLEFRKGHDRGRIYRIRPRESKLFGVPDLANADSSTLVQALSHPNAWRRTTAQRMLVERIDRSAVATLRILVADKNGAPLGRLHALWALEGLGALGEESLLAAMAHREPGVQAHAVRLAEPRLPHSAELVRRVSELVHEPNARLQLQLACTFGELPDRSPALLATIGRADPGDPWIQVAVLSSIAGKGVAFIEEMTRTGERLPPPAYELLARSAETVAIESDKRTALRLIEWAGRNFSSKKHEETIVALSGLADGLARSGKRLEVIGGESMQDSVATWFHAASKLASNSATSESVRNYAIRLLGHADWETCSRAIAGLLSAEQSQAIQEAALAALARQRGESAGHMLVDYWHRATSGIRGRILAAIFGDSRRVAILLDAIESGRIGANELELHWRILLQESADPQVRRRAANLFAGLERPASESIARFRPALDTAADHRRGGELFKKACATCHRVRGKGALVGPDLSGLVVKTKEQLLIDILDPSREVLPNYINYVVATKQGAILNGLLASESPNAIRLRRADGLEDVLMRMEIEALRATGKSLMPDGFEQTLSPAELRDIIGFLRDPQ